MGGVFEFRGLHPKSQVPNIPVSNAGRPVVRAEASAVLLISDQRIVILRRFLDLVFRTTDVDLLIVVVNVPDNNQREA